jgi:large subunit ribosomal protein L6
MSRIGRMPIPVPQGTRVELRDGRFVAEGPKGRVEQPLFEGFPVEVKDDGTIEVARSGDSGPQRSLHGLLRALLANAVQGASAGFTKQLDIVGVGYRAEVKGNQVQFALGYSHPVLYDIPAGIKIEIDKANRVTVTGADRQKVGQVAAEIRGLRRPDPYKGKGIKYTGEILRRKVGKAGGK